MKSFYFLFLTNTDQHEYYAIISMSNSHKLAKAELPDSWIFHFKLRSAGKKGSTAASVTEHKGLCQSTNIVLLDIMNLHTFLKDVFGVKLIDNLL